MLLLSNIQSTGIARQKWTYFEHAKYPVTIDDVTNLNTARHSYQNGFPSFCHPNLKPAWRLIRLNRRTIGFALNS